jgi:hypothetical protein
MRVNMAPTTGASMEQMHVVSAASKDETATPDLSKPRIVVVCQAQRAIKGIGVWEGSLFVIARDSFSWAKNHARMGRR